MAKITRENYFTVKTHISYHDILNFRKCEYLYSQDRQGKVPRIPRDYFLYGHAFDAMLTGEFPKRFIIGKDPKKSLEKLAQEKVKAKESLKKYDGKEDKRSKLFAEKAGKMIAEINLREMELDKEADKEAVSETVAQHITESVEALKRQTLMSRFPRTKDTDQHIVTTKLQGVDVKGMLDYFHKENKVIADYKTTASMRTFTPMQYRDQLAWYRMIVREKYGVDCDAYLIVADKESYVKHAFFYQFTKETLDAAESDLLSSVDRMKEALDAEIFEPAAFRDIRECFTCDNYGSCPFTVQSEPQIL